MVLYYMTTFCKHFGTSIDRFHKGRPINYSFVNVLIRRTSLVLKEHFFCTLSVLTRLVGLSSTKTIEYFFWPPFMQSVHWECSLNGLSWSSAFPLGTEWGFAFRFCQLCLTMAHLIENGRFSFFKFQTCLDNSVSCLHFSLRSDFKSFLYLALKSLAVTPMYVCVVLSSVDVTSAL